MTDDARIISGLWIFIALVILMGWLLFDPSLPVIFHRL
jgi:hypothetical protein